MIRKRLRHCLLRYRFVLSAMIITIILFNYIEHKGDLHESFEGKKCETHSLNKLSDKAKKYINFGKENQSASLNATELRQWILTQNANGKVLNMDLYGPLTTNTIVFVVQVHHHSYNINCLLASLSEVIGIQDTLIIFSHSYVNYGLNRLIQSIDFCRILQLFYPYTIQAYPNEFPGHDKNDCPPNLNKKVAIKLNCTGAMTPDVNGRYRDPAHAEKKHHWWWTANKVFEDLSNITENKEIIVFLENNFYMYRNFIYMVNSMKKIADTMPRCDFLSFRSTLDVTDENVNDLEYTTWNPKYHSNILAIDLFTWNSIKSHYDIFCGTDDNSWSRSLFDVSLHRRDGKMFKVLSSVAAIALQSTCSSVEDCACRLAEKIVKIIKLQKFDKQDLFPAYFDIITDIELYEDEFAITDYVEINGGWSDRRDKQLCTNMTIKRAKRHSVTMDKTINSENYYY